MIKVTISDPGLYAELLGGKAAQEALRAGWGSFIGILFGTIIKLIACGLMITALIQAVWQTLLVAPRPKTGGHIDLNRLLFVRHGSETQEISNRVNTQEQNEQASLHCTGVSCWYLLVFLGPQSMNKNRSCFLCLQ